MRHGWLAALDFVLGFPPTTSMEASSTVAADPAGTTTASSRGEPCVLRSATRMKRVSAFALLLACSPSAPKSADETSGPLTSATTTSEADTSTTGVETSTTTLEGTDDSSTSTGIAETGPCWAAITCEHTTGGGVQFACDPVAQDCDSGEVCVWWANDGGTIWNSTRCVDAPATPAPVGAPCTAEGSAVSGIDDCGPGALCFWVDPDTLVGECVAYCDPETSESACPRGTRCHSWEPENMAACLPDCDPLNTACSNAGCVPTRQGFACLPQQLGGDTPFELCEVTNGCAPGQSCVDAKRLPACTWDRCCSPYCDLRLPTCPEGTTCVPYVLGDPIPGLETLGLCGSG